MIGRSVLPILAMAVLVASPVRAAPDPSPWSDVELALNRGDVDDARRLAEQRWDELCRAAPDGDECASRAIEIGDLFRDASHAEIAAPFYRRAAEARRLAFGDDDPRVADALELLVLGQVAGGDLDAALATARDVARIRESSLPLSDPAVARAFHELGYRHYFLEDYAAAADALTKALASMRAASPTDPQAIVWCQSDLAEMRRLLGDYEAAETALRDAIALDRAELPEDQLRAVLLNNLGGLLWDQDRLSETERLLREALRISESDPEAQPLRIANAVCNLGVVCRSQRKWDEAEELLTRALSLARDAVGPSDPQLLYFLKEPAALFSLLGRTEDAIPLREEALAILEKLDTPQHVFRSEILREIGRDLAARERWPEAEERYAEALRIREAVLGADHPTVGVLLAEMADVTAHRAGYADPEVAARVDRALAILEAVDVAPDARASAWATRARRQRALGRTAEARASVTHAIEQIEEMRALQGTADVTRVRFLANYLDWYDDAIAWAFDDGDFESALEQAERVRARVLLDRLAAASEDLRRGVPGIEALETRENAAQIRVSQARAGLQATAGNWQISDLERAEATRAREAELDAAVKALQAIREEILLANPRWEELVSRARRRMRSADVRRDVLAANEGMLLYQIGDERSFVFFLPPAGVGELRCEELVVPDDLATPDVPAGPLGSQDLTRLVHPENGGMGIAALYERAGRPRGVTGVAPIGGSSASSPVQTLHALERILVPASIWQQVARLDEVVVVPDRQVHAIPFDALVLNPETPTYWLDEGPTVRYAHSISTLLIESESPSGTPDAVARVVSVCDPAFPERSDGRASERAATGLSRLPATRLESDAIVSAFPDGDVLVLAGDDAREERFKAVAPRCEYLHVATHGLVDPEHTELLAALAFTPPHHTPGADDGTDDGFLHLFEIYDLRLHCRLAILSACDTNVGPIVEGEGVFALSRGFLAAGARNVLASLWRLDDDAAAALVSAFFGRVVDCERAGEAPDYARFLRDAKRELREQRPAWAEPHFWAPFVLAGAG